MKISVVTPWFPNTREGWPARFVSDSVIALADAGAQLSVTVLRGWVPAGLDQLVSREHRSEIKHSTFPEIDRLRTKRYFTVPGELMRALKNRSLDCAIEASLEEEIKTFRPDLIHVHTELLAPAAANIARRWNIPFVVTLHGENTNARYLQSPKQALRFRTALSSADRVVVVGEPLKSFALSLAGRNDHIITVWNGVTPPDEQRRVPVPDTDPIELVAVSNLQEEKGLELLISALSSLFDEGVGEWCLTVIGDGPLRAQLEKQVEDSGLAAKVVFAGVMSNTDVFERLLHSDIFVLPSYREAFGVAYIEAMASGLLTIGVEGQGPSQFIEHGRTGLLVGPKDINSLEATLREVLLDDVRSWRSMADNGAWFVRGAFTWMAHAERLLDVFQAAIADRNSSMEPPVTTVKASGKSF